MKLFNSGKYIIVPVLTMVFAVLIISDSFAQEYKKVYAITNANIIVGNGKTIENGTVLIKNGMIAKVNKNVAIPSEAEVIDGTGLNVYAGFVDMQTTLGFSVPASSGRGGRGGGQAAQSNNDTPTPNKRKFDLNLRPDRVAVDLIDFNDSKFEDARKAGVTAVLTIPRRGVFPGRSSLIFTHGDNPVTAGIKNDAHQFILYQADQVRGQRSYPQTLLGVVAFQKQTLMDAQYYLDLEERFKKNPRGVARPVYDPALAELFPIVSNREPVVLSADRENDVKRAIRLGSEYNLDYIISGVTEGYRILDHLKNAGRRLVVSVKYPSARQTTGYAFNMPIKPYVATPPEGEKADKPEDPTKEIDERIKNELYGNAATLHSNGMNFVLASGNDPKNFLKNVRKAVEAGLPEDVALAKMTVEPAQMLGMADYMGTVEEGKNASLIVSTGNLFSSDGKINYVFINGNLEEVEKPVKETEGEKKDETPVDSAPATPATVVAGEWNFSLVTPQGEQSGTLTISFSDKKMSGAISMDGQEMVIKSGNVEKGKISFTVTVEEAGFDLTFNGTVTEKKMEGDADAGEFGTLTWTAERDNISN